VQNNTEIINKLKQTIKDKGLKYTKQRKIIFETISTCKNHLGAEELYNIIISKYPTEKIAKDNGFKLLNHTMYLYGLCKNCNE
jgi:Fe2+ or Zn2+ uptake regulation protein